MAIFWAHHLEHSTMKITFIKRVFFWWWWWCVLTLYFKIIVQSNTRLSKSIAMGHRLSFENSNLMASYVSVVRCVSKSLWMMKSISFYSLFYDFEVQFDMVICVYVSWAWRGLPCSRPNIFIIKKHNQKIEKSKHEQETNTFYFMHAFLIHRKIFGYELFNIKKVWNAWLCIWSIRSYNNLGHYEFWEE